METVELSDFIRDTLVEIATGITQANEKISKLQNAQHTHSYYSLRTNIGDNAKIPGVQFDVAVTATNSKSGDAGVKVKLAVIGIGGKREDTISNEMMQRIKFEIGVRREIGFS
ncbi:MAG: hypothetical protein ACK502_08335 [Alphaproteobacteria bacterium]